MSGWIDLNRDGDFNDTGEKVISDRSITSTTVSTTSVPITTPSTASKLIPAILIFLLVIPWVYQTMLQLQLVKPISAI
ncbi:GEVED domain-containing protein [Fischerella thermalis]|uniref:GEVED domain-containing protein n=1 Tax=Fischerella thermalis TaxID=372787 RepID=UPI0011AF1717|nr:GEVED domain-containing protein [Fischerella thermalis]